MRRQKKRQQACRVNLKTPHKKTALVYVKDGLEVVALNTTLGRRIDKEGDDKDCWFYAGALTPA